MVLSTLKDGQVHLKYLTGYGLMKSSVRCATKTPSTNELQNWNFTCNYTVYENAMIFILNL